MYLLIEFFYVKKIPMDNSLNGGHEAEFIVKTNTTEPDNTYRVSLLDEMLIEKKLNDGEYEKVYQGSSTEELEKILPKKDDWTWGNFLLAVNMFADGMVAGKKEPFLV